jgi:hypothetical protein
VYLPNEKQPTATAVGVYSIFNMLRVEIKNKTIDEEKQCYNAQTGTLWHDLLYIHLSGEGGRREGHRGSPHTSDVKHVVIFR